MASSLNLPSTGWEKRPANYLLTIVHSFSEDATYIYSTGDGIVVGDKVRLA